MILFLPSYKYHRWNGAKQKGFPPTQFDTNTHWVFDINTL